MLKVAALGLSALLVLGCQVGQTSAPPPEQSPNLGLTEQDLEQIRKDIADEYQSNAFNECMKFTNRLEYCLHPPLSTEVFIELKDGEASGLVRWETRPGGETLTHLCSVTVYDNGSYIWSCKP